MFKTRNWFITLCAGLVGLAISKGNKDIICLAASMGIAFWFSECLIRYYHLYRFIERYRQIRAFINEDLPQGELSLYDLSGHYSRNGQKGNFENTKRANHRIKDSFLRLETALFYFIISGVLFSLWISPPKFICEQKQVLNPCCCIEHPSK